MCEATWRARRQLSSANGKQSQFINNQNAAATIFDNECFHACKRLCTRRPFGAAANEPSQDTRGTVVHELVSKWARVEQSEEEKNATKECPNRKARFYHFRLMSAH